MQKYRRLRFILIVTALVLAWATPWAIWSWQPSSDLKLLIVDKSVPDQRYREHSALIWALNHLKLKGPRGEAWKMERDYLGYQPADPSQQIKERKDVLTGAALAGQEALFLADTYGVYRQDAAEANGISPDYSPRIYGGLEQAEVNAISAFSQRGGHVIGEFNTFASPTRDRARQDLEKLFGLSWTGWTGRFFNALENTGEIPAWARRNWKQQTGSDWAFTGPGWLLVHDDGRIVVLRQDEDIAASGLHLHLNTTDPLLSGASQEVPFYFWFDIVTAQPGSTILGEYALRVNESGRQVLKQAGIPERFPGLVLASRKPLRLYLAGDASDSSLELKSYRWAGRQTWERWTHLGGELHERGAFFWGCYLPLLRNVLDEIAVKTED
ncbi:MAG: hypothetical protein ACO1RX_01610 [Candidatus Sericytochromatia bacterium]